MESAIFGQAIKEYVRARRLLPWIVLSFLGLGLAALWSNLDAEATPSSTYITVSGMLVFHLLALASAIFTTAIVTQEVEQKTIVYLLTRPVPRWKLLLVRYAASVIVVGVLGVVAAVLTSFGATKSLSMELLSPDIPALLIGAAAYGAIFLLVSLMFNRSLIICMLYAFGWESSMPNMPGGMSRLSIYSYMQAIAEHPSEGAKKGLALLTGQLGNSTITRGEAWTTLILLIVVVLGISAWWFTHFEYIPREDAE